jgi:hypothetical protein
LAAPVYNDARAAEQALGSIWSQAFDELEFTESDGASNDRAEGDRTQTRFGGLERHPAKPSPGDWRSPPT